MPSENFCIQILHCPFVLLNMCYLLYSYYYYFVNSIIQVGPKAIKSNATIKYFYLTNFILHTREALFQLQFTQWCSLKASKILKQ